jgi:glycosyltransferase involved in cell wall biosynthesis
MAGYQRDTFSRVPPGLHSTLIPGGESGDPTPFTGITMHVASRLWPNSAVFSAPWPTPWAEPKLASRGPSGGQATVAVLLSVYNGERFLQAQLDSLHDQSCRDWVLLWRDDGSSDGSRDVMRRFTQMVGEDRCIELADTTRHVGATWSYMLLLRAAADYKLVSFADQDDVWLPEKLARAVEQMSATPDSAPALYCARQVVVDAELKRLCESQHLRRSPRFPDALVQNIAAGCTILLNQAAVALINAISPPEHSVHDWWSYIVVSAAGGRIIADGTPTIRYRQHAGNTIGHASSYRVRVSKAIRRGPGAFIRQFTAHIAALERQRHLLPLATRGELDAITSALQSGPLTRASLVCSGRLRRQTLPEDLLLAFWLCVGVRSAAALPWRQAARHGGDMVAPLR